MKVLPEIEVCQRRPALDERPLAKRIGLIVLATDHTPEPDYQRMLGGSGIGIYVARVPFANPVTRESLRDMQSSLTAAARLILPDEELDAICYSCTSASVIIGDEEVEAAIHQAKPGVPVVTPPAASVRGLRALGARRISVLTPYTAEISRPMADYFAKAGFEIERFTCLAFDDDRKMARISPASLVEIAEEAVAPEADALFISCTSLRAAGVAPEIERRIGCPVITSNLAAVWNCLRLCGDTASRPEFGRLMSLPLTKGGEWSNRT